MDRTLKALSLLLSYPTEELQKTIPEIADVLATDPRLDCMIWKTLCPLLDELGQSDIYDVEERYVMLFDRSRTLSLNLFEHVHGESRDRGGAMVSLIETYREAGFDPQGPELPDHLPVLLEFLAMRPEAEAKETLADAAHIFEALKTRLIRRESAYAAVFEALAELAGGKADREAVAVLLEEPETDPNDLEKLDEVWEESEVLFGPDPNAGCPQAREMLAKIDQPVTPAPRAASV